MKLSLHPNPGNGMSWVVTLAVAGHELSADVSEREVPWRNRPVPNGDGSRKALLIARQIAASLDLSDEDMEEDMEHVSWSRL